MAARLEDGKLFPLCLLMNFLTGLADKVENLTKNFINIISVFSQKSHAHLTAGGKDIVRELMVKTMPAYNN